MRRAWLALPLAALLTPAPRAQVAPPADSLITATSVGRVRVCQPLDSVGAEYPSAQDTMLFGPGGVRWPGKIVPIGPAGRLFIEASYVDRSRVWRITTTSPSFATASGLKVGSTLAAVLALRDRLTFQFPSGYLVARMTKARISFQVDDSSASRFYRTWGGRGNPLQSLDRSARIKLITVSGSCRQSRAGT